MTRDNSKHYGRYQADLYAAEVVIDDLGLVWTDIRQVRDYVADLLASDWFSERWPDTVVKTIVRGRGRTSYAGGGFISMAVLDQPTVLHELAHLCAGDSLGHNPVFARAYLTLVRQGMGVHAYGALLSSLRDTTSFADVDLSCVEPTFDLITR